MQQETYRNPKFCYICKEKLQNKYFKDKKDRKVRDHYHCAREYRGATPSICDLKYSVAQKIPIAFHNRWNYDYYFIIKELAEEFENQFTCLGENTIKYITISVLIEKKVTRIDKNFAELRKNYLTYYSLLLPQ